MKKYHYLAAALCVSLGLYWHDPAMAVSGESESETDFSEDVLFEDIESVYSASKIKRGKRQSQYVLIGWYS